MSRSSLAPYNPEPVQRLLAPAPCAGPQLSHIPVQRSIPASVGMYSTMALDSTLEEWGRGESAGDNLNG